MFEFINNKLLYFVFILIIIAITYKIFSAIKRKYNNIIDNKIRIRANKEIKVDNVIIESNYYNFIIPKTASILHKPIYKDNKEAGELFEIEVNNLLVKNIDTFALYWSSYINIYPNYKVTYHIEGDFFNNDKKFLMLQTRKRIEIDNIVVTPYAVYIFELKYYSDDYKYTEDGKNLRRSKGNDNSESISNPIYQLNMQVEIFKQILIHYQIDLPVIGRVVFNKNIINNIKFDEGNNSKDFYITKYNLIDFIISNNNLLTNRYKEALKLIKSLYYSGLEPVAYDSNFPNWYKNDKENKND